MSFGDGRGGRMISFLRSLPRRLASRSLRQLKMSTHVVSPCQRCYCPLGTFDGPTVSTPGPRFTHSLKKGRFFHSPVDRYFGPSTQIPCHQLCPRFLLMVRFLADGFFFIRNLSCSFMRLEIKWFMAFSYISVV